MDETIIEKWRGDEGIVGRGNERKNDRQKWSKYLKLFRYFLL